jgi:uncharacterized metal-binding protein YceD (DUF177 family)
MGRRDYEIAFVGLQPGVHEFEYQVKDQFFDTYQAQEFKNCKATVKLTLEKNPGFMLLKFEVGGSLSASCDRCGNDLLIELWDDFNIIVKLVENPEKMNAEEEDPDIYYIARTEGILDVKDWIFEFINLSVPLQKMCSEEEMGGPLCNKEVLDMLKKLKETSGESAAINIWKDLDKFKNLDNN